MESGRSILGFLNLLHLHLNRNLNLPLSGNDGIKISSARLRLRTKADRHFGTHPALGSPIASPIPGNYVVRRISLGFGLARRHEFGLNSLEKCPVEVRTEK